MFVKVILSHSEGGGQGGGGGGGGVTLVDEKSAVHSLPKTKCSHSFTASVKGAMHHVTFYTVVLLPFISTLFVCQSNEILLLFSP